MPQPATSSLSRTALRTEPECSASTRRLRLCKLARSAPPSTFKAGRPLRVALSLRSVACDAGFALRLQGALYRSEPRPSPACHRRLGVAHRGPRHLTVLSIPSSASCFSWSSTAHWVEPHTVTRPSVMSTAPTPGTPQFTARTWCVGLRELDIPPAIPDSSTSNSSPAGKSSVEPARLQPGDVNGGDRARLQVVSARRDTYPATRTTSQEQDQDSTGKRPRKPAHRPPMSASACHLRPGASRAGFPQGSTLR